MALEGKRRLFVDEYVRRMNGAEAARRAGYSHARARFTASDLLRDPEIKEAIAERYRESAMGTDEVLHHLAEVARGAHSEYVTPAGFDLAACVEAGDARLVKSIKDTTAGRSFEFCDRLAALQLIGRNQKMFTDGLDVNSAEVNDKIRRLMEKLGVAGEADPPGSTGG